MLEVRRHCVEALCRGRGLSWREDPTNADVSITRNWIRHGLIGPLRERFGEDLIERLCTLAAEAAELDGLLAARGQALLEGARTPPPAFPRCPRWQAAVPGSWLKTAALAACDEATLQAAMRIELQRLGRPLGAMGRAHYRRLSELIRRGGSEAEGLSLPGGTSARVHAGRLWVVATEELPLPLAERPDSPSVPLKVPGTHPLGGGLELRCRFVDLDGPLRARILRGRERQAFYLDADRLEGPLRLRRISPGDRMRPLGSPGGKLLSDLLAGRGVEPVLRGETRCVCDEAGIVCALPVEIADRVRIGPDSLRAVVLHIQ
jgi:tRNA(Ile)-lysidine synthase